MAPIPIEAKSPSPEPSDWIDDCVDSASVAPHSVPTAIQSAVKALIAGDLQAHSLTSAKLVTHARGLLKIATSTATEEGQPDAKGN